MLVELLTPLLTSEPINTAVHFTVYYHKNGKLVNSDLELDNDSDDIYSLGMHIVIDHKLIEKGDFDKFYSFNFIL